MELVFSLLDPAVPQHMRSNDHVTGSPGLHSCNEGLNVIKAVSSSILHGTRVDWKRCMVVARHRQLFEEAGVQQSSP